MVLLYQHVQEGPEARFGVRTVRDSELPEDVGTRPAFDRTDAPAETDGPVQDLVRPPPVQGADGIPVEILVGPAQQDRDQFAHGTRVVPRMGRVVFPG